VKLRFHPLYFANALEVLRTELEDELKGDGEPLALALFRLELAFVTEEARAWAAVRGLAFEFPEPDPECSALECILLLRGLTVALRDVASRVSQSATNDNATDDESTAGNS
jgi:hypothetical protein